MKNQSKSINRRDFFKIVGISTASTATLYGCGQKADAASDKHIAGAVPTDKMVYRNFAGDTVSLLGYGCMRWPTLPDRKSVV